MSDEEEYERIRQAEEYSQIRLSELYEQYKDVYGFGEKWELNEMVLDSLAIEHYPDFQSWFHEYGEGRNANECYPIFLDFQRSRDKFKRLVGDNYERFIGSHVDL